MFHTRGFTVIELLVVIGIVSTLGTVGGMMYANSVRASRDTRRITDIQNIRSQVELFKASQSTQFYPMNMPTIQAYAGGSASIPKDPQTQNDYSYVPVPATCNNTSGNYCTSYTLTAQLEKDAVLYVATHNTVTTTTPVPTSGTAQAIPTAIPTRVPTQVLIPPTRIPNPSNTPQQPHTTPVRYTSGAPTCVTYGGSCSTGETCCSPMQCYSNSCLYSPPPPATSTPAQCVPLGEQCTISGTQCCAGSCIGARCQTGVGNPGRPNDSM